MENYLTVPVLIIDDDKRFRESLRTVLEAAGYTVAALPDADSGMRLLRASPTGMVVYVTVQHEASGVHLIHALMQDNHLARRHAYVLLSANSERDMHALGAALKRLSVPLVPRSVDANLILPITAFATNHVASA